MILCKDCNHPESEHIGADSYYSEDMEDEVWSNDICEHKGCYCWHFEDEDFG